MSSIKVSAPGKLHLLGEHSVVYDRPAIIAAVNKRCFVEITKKENAASSITSEFDTKYPEAIINEFFKYHKLDSFPNFDITIKSEIPVGCGMGSSAALAVSVAGALTLFADLPFDKNQINKIAFLSEKIMHGNPSGGDNSASTFGGFIWFKKSEGIKPLDLNLSEDILNNFFIINTGTPQETTGEMVSEVKKLFDKDTKFINDIFDDQEILVRDLLLSLKEKNSEKIIENIRKGEQNLEAIGVVSNSSKQIIREIEKLDGAAKICGAGGIKNSTGIILVYYPRKEMLAGLNYNIEPVTLGAEGLRIE